MQTTTFVDRYTAHSTAELQIPVNAALVTPEEAQRLDEKWPAARAWVNDWRQRNGLEPL